MPPNFRGFSRNLAEMKQQKRLGLYNTKNWITAYGGNIINNLIK